MTRGAFLLLAAAVPALAQAWPTFYSAYEDGLAAQARGDHARAVQAFQRAIALNPAPGREVRTYGLNFLALYAPYLRLAESQMALGDLSGAAATLARSEALGGEPAAERQALRARLQGLQARAAQAAAPPSAPPPAQPMPRPAPSPVQVQAPPTPAPAEPSAAPAPRLRPPEPAHRLSAPASAAPAPSPGAPARATAPPAAAPPAFPPPPPSHRGWWLGGSGLLLLAAASGLATRRRKGTAPPAPVPEPTQLLPAPADPTSSRDPNLGRTFGRYVARRVLGRGGCATAYYGEDPETGEEVAIKVPHPHLLDQGDFQARFRREAELGILLAHARIVPLIDAGPEAGDPWLVTRFIPGDTLSSHLHRHAPLGIPEAVALASDIAEAIHFAHERGVVHRDLKPANVMVTVEGALVMDFGIARVADGALTATTMFLGTPLYCAPEAVVSSRVGPPADWYALGIMLFEMLTGQVPFQAESSFQILESHRTRPLPDLRAIRPMTPPPLEELVRRLCAKAPEARPSGTEILDILGRLRTLHPAPRRAVDAGS